MKIFLDTAEVSEIKEAASWGVLSGVTTNPSLVAKSGRPFREVIREICAIVDGPVSAETTSPDAEGMLREAREYSKWHKNVVVKFVMGEEGLKAVHRASKEGIRSNVTLIFSPNQALLAARAGATIVSPFVGRLDDINEDGMNVVAETAEIFKLHGIKTQVLAASIRHPLHVTQAALAGADIATIPFAVLKQMVRHPLTESGTKKFLEDWQKAKK
ncbi:fructose-6-phosphate aldolase [Candidatus Micrarchaeota archaeon]|nr:fructose-6-phosphate aldolase [Candidatus Micrarchaeota archaeon]